MIKLATLSASLVLLAAPALAQQAPMSFFVTSKSLGNGGNLGGLAGADAHCQSLAAAVGAGGKTWRAYLSAKTAGGQPAVNAKDRIGGGPWANAKGVVIATSVADLHSDKNKINKESALDETGKVIPGRGDTPNQHDILTGSLQDGTVETDADGTCSNWTSAADGQGGARVGHTDLQGNPAGINFWNFSHITPGCAQPNLVRVGGAGLFYCFATN